MIEFIKRLSITIANKALPVAINAFARLYPVLSQVNFRMVISIFIAYIVLKIAIIDTVFTKIKKETSNSSALDKLHSLIKETKETAQITERLTKSLGLENLPSKDIISYKGSGVFSSNVVLKQEGAPISPYNLIPLCGSKINANIVGKTKGGAIFFDEEVEFTLGEFNLPVGLEKGAHKMTTSHQYDVIVPIAELYFIAPPSPNLQKLKYLKADGFVSYSVRLNKVDKAFNVKGFEPRIFYLSRGRGEEVLCGSSVGVHMKTSRLDGTVIGQDDYVFNIGNAELPYGLEHVLMRLRQEDKVVTFLNSDWLTIEESKRLKIRLPKEKYMFLEISIKSVKQSEKAFKAHQF